uniref:Ovule protein n=1 Tax=Acrobeloides nanus TaxID=290746 RepID=A0A914DV25_9BILA
MVISLYVQGIVYFVLCILCLAPYFVVLKIMISNKSIIQFYSYQIMVHLGIMDIGQFPPSRIFNFITFLLRSFLSSFHISGLA